MSGTDKLIGTWKADMGRWGDLAPDMAALGEEMMQMMLGTLEVEFSANSLAIKNYGGKQNVREGSFSAREEGGKLILDATLGSSGRKGVFEVEFLDDDHIDFILVEPKRDPMALQRA